MGIKRGQITELEITDMAFGGKGFAKVDGLAIFVDGAVIHDKVSVRITKKKKKFAEAKTLEVLEKSNYRVDPVCYYSNYCGGCKWQFLSYDKQLVFKKNHVSESLEHIGLIKDVHVHDTLPSDPFFGYRNKMEFSCTDQRWLMPEELSNPDIKKGTGIGLHVPGTFNKVIDIKACHIWPSKGNLILDDIRAFILDSGLEAYHLKNHTGFWRFVMMRHSVAGNEWMVNIVTKDEEREVVQELADLLVNAHPEITSVVNNVTSRKAGVSTGEYEILLSGNPYLIDRLGKYEFEISANSFFQTNTRSAEKLYSKVSEYAGLTGNEIVLDLYSGTGTIPIWLSENAKEVTGIEIVESAVLDAEKNCRKNGVTNCSFIAGDMKDILPKLSVKPDVMIIDPPRVGMHKDVVSEVMKLAPERIVYVSCNPATLARDLLELKKLYKVCEVQPVDMFPHTFHIEAVARLEKRNTDMERG